MALDNMQTTRLERKFAISDEAGLQVQNPLFHAPGRNREPLKKTPECMEQPDAGSRESSTMTKIALNGERSSIKIARYTEPGKIGSWKLRGSPSHALNGFHGGGLATGSKLAASSFATETEQPKL
jgi:hypothetical protein